jgi:hypothetical protein
VLCAHAAFAQVAPSGADLELRKALLTIEKLADRVAAQEARIQELEADRAAVRAAAGIQPVKFEPAVYASPAAPAEPPAAPVPPANPVVEPPQNSVGEDAHDHMVQLPGGGPALKIRGFFDFNFGLGTASNNLVFPLPPAGRSTFQAGEMDLFLSSKLARNLSFIGEIVIGSDQTNEWGLDIERIQLTYRPSKYFEISGGRFHSAIGYYNTAFHHGTWFQTATGRPFMYFFEDSGGLLPVHQVGVTTTGLVPGTGSLGLHWVAEAGNGHSSNPSAPPVQNFLADKTSKATNFAAYIKPHWAPGLQMGASIYHDRQYPLGLRVDQRISSAYLVYDNSTWEFLAEGVLLTNHPQGSGRDYNTPLSYAQISRKFHRYRPYFRYQYVNSIEGDPVNQYTGLFQGPSAGLRVDVSDFAAFKVQYNRIFQHDVSAQNGLALQMSFAF